MFRADGLPYAYTTVLCSTTVPPILTNFGATNLEDKSGFRKPDPAVVTVCMEFGSVVDLSLVAVFVNMLVVLLAIIRLSCAPSGLCDHANKLLYGCSTRL